MKNVSRILPCYAADTSGVCSAMYELGGMTVIHDASGCNSTYTTHDEPRWYDKRSMVFISALTELDAIMGNDEQLISDTVSAAADLKPAFITLCGSPMPMMTGVDFDAIAQEIQKRSGIRTFGLHTNGTLSYISGASQAFEAIVRSFVRNTSKRVPKSVNIIGATPLDFGLSSTIESTRKWLTDCGFKVISCLAEGSALEEIKEAATAEVNLVVSASGLTAARYMYKYLGVPFVCGLPLGENFPTVLCEALFDAVKEHKIILRLPDRTSVENEVVIIGESVYSAALAAALCCETNFRPRVISPLTVDKEILSEKDLDIFSEEDIEAALKEIKPQFVLADPLYAPVIPEGAKLVSLPHTAFSGRSFLNEIPDLINRPIRELTE